MKRRTTTPTPHEAAKPRRSRRPTSPPPPPPSLDPESLPAALTFFLTASQRREVLDRLRGLHPDRAAALLAALNITTNGDTQ